jgi:oligoendopeptidase F
MSKTTKNEWNLGLLYKSLSDPQIEKDMVELETMCGDFYKKYTNDGKKFLSDKNVLLKSLEDYFKIEGKLTPKPIIYITFTIHKDSSNNKAQSLLNLMTNRSAKALNLLSFYSIDLGKISIEKQNEILNDEELSKYHFFLSCVFSDAKHNLSEAEERIINLKRLPASDMWDNGHDKILSSVVIKWKGKDLPLAQANGLINESNQSDRLRLSQLIATELKKVAVFSEAEINALVTNKKIDDELRGYASPSDETIRNYRNDPQTVAKLVDIVTKSFPVSHKFYKIKAKLLKQKNLRYCDRLAKYAKVNGDFSFDKSKESLLRVFGSFDKKYADILSSYIRNGQIDVFPKKGKTGGAYCWGTFQNPTFVLLNHTNSLKDYSTIAHEMGHAFHTELSKSQGPVYSSYSTSLAETASTFFESLAFDELVEALPEKQKIIALHNKINDDISTIFRQIACFNFENDIHNTVRKNGLVSKEELAELHNKNMKAYLGPIFKMEHDDGYLFVQWGHIRRFFYVYSYAYGLLVSKALLRRYKKDKTFIKSIEKFLSSGGKDTPENILKEIGLDVTTGALFKEGIEQIEDDIKRLEELIK